MALTSSVPLLKAELVERWSGKTYAGADSTRFTGLAAVIDNDDVRVSWGNPHPDRLADVLLIIDDTKDYRLESVAGLSQANELYAVSCYISIAKHARDDRLAQWQRAYDLWSEVLTDLYRMNVEADLPPQVSVLLPGPADDQDAISADVREASITFDLLVTARLTNGD